MSTRGRENEDAVECRAAPWKLLRATMPYPQAVGTPKGAWKHERLVFVVVHENPSAGCTCEGVC